MAYYKQFGDNYRHEPRTASTTLAKLQVAESLVDPWDLFAYRKEAMKFRYNGVHRPFWRDWPLSDPSIFLTSEPLHHWHKGFWDHDAKWCIYAVGSSEIDFRFAVLHPHTGFRHFKEGISSLKQVTGREHRDVQRYIVAVITDAVPQEFLIAIRNLMDFRYLAQSRVITDETCTAIDNSLHEFHNHKEAIINAGARRGKKATIDNWYIPKLEFLQSVVPNIHANGVAIQWSADTTEHAHITAVKDPARSGNNQNYESQICRYLDRLDKLRQFDLATAIKDAKIGFRANPHAKLGDVEGEDVEGKDVEGEDAELDEREVLNITSSSSLLTHIDPVSTLSGTSRHTVNYFYQASALKRLLYNQVNIKIPLPLRTDTCSGNIAFHLTRDPSYKRLSVDEASQMYCLPDLRPALSDYLHRTAGGHETHCLDVGGRRLSPENCPLPFSYIEVWTKIYLQSKAYHPPHPILPPQTINAGPPSSPSGLGHYDSVIINIDPTKDWPFTGLNGKCIFVFFKRCLFSCYSEGHAVVDLRLIFRIVPTNPQAPSGNRFLTYVQRFNIIPHVNEPVSGSRTAKGPYPEPSSGLYLLKRAKRSNKAIIGDIIPLDQIRALVDLVPRFGKKANRVLSKENSVEYSIEFWLNKYFTKELFLTLTHCT
jgi:Plavaka transposase